jgi:hypothetical protein
VILLRVEKGVVVVVVAGEQEMFVGFWMMGEVSEEGQSVVSTYLMEVEVGVGVVEEVHRLEC